MDTLWNYYRDEPRNPLSTNSKCFKCKTSIIGKTTQDNDSLTNAKIVILIKHFWRALNIPLINCEMELILTRSKNRVLADITPRDAKGETFKIKEQNCMIQLLLCQKKMT